MSSRSVETELRDQELSRIRRAARRRRLSVPEYVRQAAIAQSDEDLAAVRFRSDPYERRDVSSFPVASRRSR